MVALDLCVGPLVQGLLCRLLLRFSSSAAKLKECYRETQWFRTENFTGGDDVAAEVKEYLVKLMWRRRETLVDKVDYLAGKH